MADTEQLDEDKRCTLFDKAQTFCQRCSEFHTADDWMASCERYIGAAPIRQCKTCGGWHPLDRWNGNCMPEPNWNESDLNVCRNFISDNLESIGGLNGIQCQASGLMFTSKSKLRREYKARGMIEVGNDAARFKQFQKPKPDRKKIKEALHKAMYAVKNEGATSANYRARSKAPKGAFGAVSNARSK